MPNEPEMMISFLHMGDGQDLKKIDAECAECGTPIVVNETGDGNFRLYPFSPGCPCSPPKLVLRLTG